MNILIIEDEPLIRETMAEILSLEGHKSTLAADGDEGIELFMEGAYDIVFTDLTMPGLSGWEVTRAIKQHHGELPVVIITGWEASIDQSEIDESGVAGVLPKPFKIDELLGIVRQLTT